MQRLLIDFICETDQLRFCITTIQHYSSDIRTSCMAQYVLHPLVVGVEAWFLTGPNEGLKIGSNGHLPLFCVFKVHWCCANVAGWVQSLVFLINHMDSLSQGVYLKAQCSPNHNHNNMQLRHQGGLKINKLSSQKLYVYVQLSVSCLTIL